MSQTKQQPIFKKQLRGGIALAIFEHSTAEGRSYPSVNLQRSYFSKKKNDWVRMNIIIEHQQIPLAQAVLAEAWDYLNGDYMERLPAFAEEPTIDEVTGEIA